MPVDTKAEMALGVVAERYYEIRDYYEMMLDPGDQRVLRATCRIEAGSVLPWRYFKSGDIEAARKVAATVAAHCIRFLVDVPPTPVAG